LKIKIPLLVGPLVLGAATLAMPPTAAAATQHPLTQVDADATDLGPSDKSATVTASIILKVRNQSDLERYVQETATPGSPHYRKVLSVSQFRSQYAPSDDEVEKLVCYLRSCGLKVLEVYPNNLLLKVSGTVDQFNAAFNADLHDYSKQGKKFRKPKKSPKIPDLLKDSVLVIAGLDTEAKYKPMIQTTVQDTGASSQSITLPKGGSTATGVPQEFTVGDVANMYGVNPLYKKGITGQGQTIGIVTLADFYPSDANTYWDSIGLKYKKNRITQVHVDGGGELSTDAGSGETTLDVEQAGGLAPDADILVYDAPNTDAGFLDVFYRAISDNKVDTLSVSWGLPEIFYTAALNNGVDYTNELQAFHQVFMEAAAQGISLFAASGDAGAYDANRNLPYPDFSKVLSVDAPASDPYITSAGGTTVPVTLKLSKGKVKISEERPWAWDYLLPLGYDPSILFPVGGGGGVSVMWPRPWYQQGVPGMRNSEPNQSVIDNTVDPPVDYYDLPANFVGRNGPDISMNADPETGYLLYSTPDGGWIAGNGGTSFVSPQLNGMTALLDQYVGGRVGFLNPTLYRLQQNLGYGRSKPFDDIVGGGNWFYQGTPGFDPASGIGTPNWANLADAVRAEGTR
jgi:kumamolisin